MKAPFLFSALLAATQFVGTASAENKSTAERDAEIIQRYDTNKNGKLDEAEVAAVKEEMLTSKMEKRDEQREKVQERRDEWLKEFDKNGDGKLDETEKKTMESTLRTRMEKNPRMMKRIDTNEDGKIDDQEWAAAREKLMGRLREGNKK